MKTLEYTDGKQGSTVISPARTATAYELLFSCIVRSSQSLTT
jgi:hypothetical protein